MDKMKIEETIDNVSASFAIEGIHLTDENKRNGGRILRGEASIGGVVSEIRRKYGVMEYGRVYVSLEGDQA